MSKTADRYLHSDLFNKLATDAARKAHTILSALDPGWYVDTNTGPSPGNKDNEPWMVFANLMTRPIDYASAEPSGPKSGEEIYGCEGNSFVSNFDEGILNAFNGLVKTMKDYNRTVVVGKNVRDPEFKEYTYDEKAGKFVEYSRSAINFRNK